MNAGEYQAGIAPYGYKKDTEVKNHLVIDENVSYIVQEIFDMYANRNELPGNYIDLLFSYSIEVDWDELYKSFIHFLSFSLIKK